MKRPVLLLLPLLLIGSSLFWLFPVPKERRYRFVREWGRKGKAVGRFNGPVGIAIGKGRVYVSDSGNHRIEVFSKSGKFLYAFGKEGERKGELARPMHIALRDSRLYVAEYLNDRVQTFSLYGKPLEMIQGKGFNAPAGVDLDKQGELLIADFYNHRVVAVKKKGELSFQIGKKREKSLAKGALNYPTDVEVLPNGEILVADAYNHRIQIFTSNGKFLKRFGSFHGLFRIPAPFYGWFSVATGIGTDKKGDIFVADFYNHRIQKFHSDGRFLTVFGKGKLNYPTDVAIDSRGEVYVVEFGGNRVSVWKQK